MSDSGSDRSRRRHRRRRTPYVAFYGPVGGNGFAAADSHFGPSAYQDYADPPINFLRDHDRMRIVERDASPPTRMCSWIVDAMERLAADINSYGFEPRKSSKTESPSKPVQQTSEPGKALIEGMNAKLTKLEDAMKSVQEMLQSCLERVRKGQEHEAASGTGRREIQSPAWRQRRFRSPDRYLYRG